INRNHNEAVFLYDMLNEKAKEVKNTVKDVNTAKRQVELMYQPEQSKSNQTDNEKSQNDLSDAAKAARERLVQLDSKSTEKLNSAMTGKGNQAVELDKIVSGAEEKTPAAKKDVSKRKNTKTVSKEAANMNIQFEKGANNNDNILELYKRGVSNKDIAKQLNLGVGEVKLVIDLYNGGK
ncbi:MAG: DUF6115 domain-containing protein, partial [Eubacteriales bacterium]|nr:DUF6115 domain-containing protein [Eubacteriales bacterium]